MKMTPEESAGRSLTAERVHAARTNARQLGAVGGAVCPSVLIESPDELEARAGRDKRDRPAGETLREIIANPVDDDSHGGAFTQSWRGSKIQRNTGNGEEVPSQRNGKSVQRGWERCSSPSRQCRREMQIM